MQMAPRIMRRSILILIGSFATALAIAGALLPGLPTTPFLLVALWAFARSSKTLHEWLRRMPLLGKALIEARRFEQKRALRPAVKITALSMAWGSVLLTAFLTGAAKPVVLSIVSMAAIAATISMWLIPTDYT